MPLEFQPDHRYPLISHNLTLYPRTMFQADHPVPETHRIKPNKPTKTTKTIKNPIADMHAHNMWKTTAKEIRAMFLQLAIILSAHPDKDFYLALHASSKYHIMIPDEAVPPLVSSICGSFSTWHPGAIVSVRPLLQSLSKHAALAIKHTRLINECVIKTFLSVMKRRSYRQGDMLKYERYAHILSDTLATCHYKNVEELSAPLALADALSTSKLNKDRVFAIRLLQGLAQSPNAASFAKAYLLPRLAKMLTAGEDTNLADLIYAYACAIKHESPAVKMETLWFDVRTLWYDSGLDELRDRTFCISSLCEIFTKSASAEIFDGKNGHQVKEMLVDLCQFIDVHCECFGEYPSNSVDEFLRRVAANLGPLEKLMELCDDKRMSAAHMGMMARLNRSLDAAIRKACCQRFSLNSGMMEEKTEVEDSKKRLGFRMRWKRVVIVVKMLACWH